MRISVKPVWLLLYYILVNSCGPSDEALGIPKRPDSISPLQLFLLGAGGIMLLWVANKIWKKYIAKDIGSPKPDPSSPSLPEPIKPILITVTNEVTSEEISYIKADPDYYYLPSQFKLAVIDDRKPIEVYRIVKNNQEDENKLEVLYRLQANWTAIDSFFVKRREDNDQIKLKSILPLCIEKTVEKGNNSFHTQQLSIDIQEGKYIILKVSYDSDVVNENALNSLKDFAIIRNNIGLNVDLLFSLEGFPQITYKTTLNCQLNNIRTDSISAKMIGTRITISNKTSYELAVKSLFIFETPVLKDSWHRNLTLQQEPMVGMRANYEYDWPEVMSIMESIKTARPERNLGDVSNVIPLFDAFASKTNNSIEQFINVSKDDLTLNLLYTFQGDFSSVPAKHLRLKTKIEGLAENIQDIRVADGQVDLKNKSIHVQVPVQILNYTKQTELEVNYSLIGKDNSDAEQVIISGNQSLQDTNQIILILK